MTDIFKRKPKREIIVSDIDLCVFCGEETEYKKDTPIEKRDGYIKGAGQLCRKCFHEIYPEVATGLTWES